MIDPHNLHGALCREGGDVVTAHYRIHAPRWWNLWAHVVWLVALIQSRTGRISLSTGETLKTVTVPLQAPRPAGPKEKP